MQMHKCISKLRLTILEVDEILARSKLNSLFIHRDLHFEVFPTFLKNLN